MHAVYTQGLILDNYNIHIIYEGLFTMQTKTKTDIKPDHKLIRFYRKLARRSQEQSAYAIGMTQSNFSKIESGEVEITLENLVILAEYLDRDVCDFFPQKIRDLYSRATSTLQDHLEDPDATIASRARTAIDILKIVTMSPVSDNEDVDDSKKISLDKLLSGEDNN